MVEELENLNNEQESKPAEHPPEVNSKDDAQKIERIVFADKDDAPEPVAHDDFDWEAGNDLKLPYSDSEIEAYSVEYEATFKPISSNEIVSGKVAAITATDIVLNIGFKSDGLVSRSEFRDMPTLAVGDDVDIYVVEKEDMNGQLVLSRKRAKMLKAWEGIVDAHQNDKVVTGTIVSKTKGGLIANVLGLETFLPGSQIDVKPILDYDQFVGKKMEFKVVKINETIKNAVVSHKALIESDLEEQRQKIIGQLEKGQVLEGVIKNITDFGAFIDLGGVDGLLYITDISWGRVNHPSEVLENGQKLNVVVLDYDDNKKRISLGLKQLQPHPWEVLTETVSEGSVIKGKVVNIEDYGAFLEVQPGVEGLVHISEVSWSSQPINSRDFFKMGETYEAKVVTISREERKMSLSVKQLSTDPWENIQTAFPINSRHVGIVRNITPYGVFVELNDGIGGMVHISDLSWTKRYNHPSEFTKVGNELDVIVKEIDTEGRKLALSHKHVEEDPWDTFETVFPKGSAHEGTVTKRDEKGGIVQMPYGVEAYAPKRHLKKEDESFAAVDETLTFVVIDFNREDKRIMVSHTSTFTEGMEVQRERKQKRDNDGKDRKRRDINKANKNVEQATLGDLDMLRQLKQQLEESEKK